MIHLPRAPQAWLQEHHATTTSPYQYSYSDIHIAINIYILIYVYIYIHIYIYTYMHIHICICTCIHTYTYKYIYIYIHVHIHCIHANAHIYIYLCVYIYVCMFVWQPALGLLWEPGRPQNPPPTLSTAAAEVALPTKGPATSRSPPSSRPGFVAGLRCGCVWFHPICRPE